MLIKSKFLVDAGWKDLAAKNKLKDNGLAKTLERLKRTADEAYDDQARALEEVVKLVAALKKDKAVTAVPAVVKYVGEMQGDAEAVLRDVAKARAEHEKATKAKAEAERAAAKRAEQDEDDDEDDESPEVLTSKLKPLLKLVAKGQTMHALLAKSGKQVVVMLSRKPIPPARRKILAEQLGGGSTKYYPGTCSLEAGSTTFALKAEVAGMAKLVKVALLEQTGLRLNKIKCRGEDGDDHDDDDGSPPAAEQPGASAADSTPGAPGAGTLTISAASGATKFKAGSSERFKVTLQLPGGSTRDVTAEVSWDPSDRGVQISSIGHAELNAMPGEVKVKVTHAKSGATGSFTITVVERFMYKVVITPKNPLVEIGEFARLRATGYFSDGSDEDVTEEVTWKIWRPDDEMIARVSSSGHCEGKASGTATVWAGDPQSMVNDMTKVTVHAAGKGPKLVKIVLTPADPTISDFTPRQFTAMGKYADNSEHEVTTKVRWESAKPHVLSVSDLGLATPGLVSDSVLITAAFGDGNAKVDARTEVEVNLPQLQSVDITPRDTSVPEGDSVSFRAMGTFSMGPQRDITNQLKWSSTKSAVALPVGNSGLIQSASQGTADISATDPASKKSDTITVTVLPPVVSFIDITPAGPLQVNAKQTFTATATLTNGRSEVLTGAKIKWNSSDTNTLSIDPHSGHSTAKAPGPATVTATSPGSSTPGILTVTVEVPKVTSVRIEPERPSVKVRGSVPLKATVVLSNGDTEDRTGDVYWSSDKENVASVDANSGKVTGVAVGQARISAISDGVPGSVEVEVTP